MATTPIKHGLNLHCDTQSSKQFIAVGSSMIPIAGYQFSLNVPSSVGAKVSFIALQAGIG